MAKSRTVYGTDFVKADLCLSEGFRYYAFPDVVIFGGISVSVGSLKSTPPPALLDYKYAEKYLQDEICDKIEDKSEPSQRNAFSWVILLIPCQSEKRI